MTQIIEMMDAFRGHETFFITYVNPRKIKDQKMYYLKCLGKDPVKFLVSVPIIFRILLKEKPDIILSTGSEIAIPVIYIGWLLGIRTIFVESLSRVKNPSGTGKIVYPVSTIFLVQWEQLLEKYGNKAKYWGNIL
jgi:UDP-N-acetylglucosamine:LPS N-acetylglucosamine transferase